MRPLRLVDTNWVAHSVEKCDRVEQIDRHGCSLQMMPFDTRLLQFDAASERRMGLRWIDELFVEDGTNYFFQTVVYWLLSVQCNS